MHRFRLTFLLLAAVAATAAWTLGAPATASADRCQPEELVLGGSTLVDEGDNPVCVVVLRVVYPALACDSTTMPRCLATLDPAATVAMLPYTVTQTPGRATSAVAEIPAATIRAARDGCTLDIRWADDFVVCRIDALRSRLPPLG